MYLLQRSATQGIFPLRLSQSQQHLSPRWTYPQRLDSSENCQSTMVGGELSLTFCRTFGHESANIRG